jgi:hypothetical protein
MPGNGASLRRPIITLPSLIKFSYKIAPGLPRPHPPVLAYKGVGRSAALPASVIEVSKPLDRATLQAVQQLPS